MAFTPINYEEGTVIEMSAATEAFTKGEALTISSGNVTAASAGQGGEVFAVSMEAKTIATAGDPLKCIITRGVRFLADCDAAPAQTDVGTVCDLASATTLDPDASTDDLFYIEQIFGKVATSTKVIGYFMHENPNS